MIIYALIVRTEDGLPLSATTDLNDEHNKNFKETKKYVKMMANKAAQLPDRCVLKLVDSSIYMVKVVSVSYLVMCEPHYSVVLSFSFLNELFREFSVKYDPTLIAEAKRPYLFIEFDNFIHKARQRYNKPQNLTTKVNLSELSSEIKMRPPYQLSITDVETMKNGYRHSNIPQLGVGPPPKLEPLPWYAMISILPTVFLILLELYRGFSALQVASIEEHGVSPVHGFIFLLEGVCRMFQLYLLLYNSKYRRAESWLCFLALTILIVTAYDLRDTSQNVAFLGIASAIHICTLRRKLQPKLPDYNV